jgi:hypothetical protein
MLLGLAGRGFAYLASALGLAIWLLGVTLLIYAALHDMLGGDVGAVDFAHLGMQDLARVALVTGGALIGLVASVMLLRFTHRIIPFLVCLAFGTLAFIGGATWRNEQTASEPQIAASSPELAAPEEEPAAAATPAEPPSNDKTASASQPAPPPPAVASPPPPAPSRTDDILPGAGAPSSEMAGANVGGAPRSGVARRTPPRAAARPAEAAPALPDLSAPSGGGAVARAEVAKPGAAAPADEDFGMREAELKFNKPNEMQLGAEYVVGATIALPGTENLPETLGNVGPTVSRQTKITRKVRVTLGGNDFDVTSLDTIDTVVVTRDSPGQWNWRVKPRRDGQNLKLRITVFGVEEADGKELGVRQLKVYDETINVNVTPIGRVRQVSANFVENWQPVAGAMGILGGIWAFLGHFFAGLRRKKETKEAA